MDVYSLADDITEVKGDSKVYFLQEAENNKYEVYFGDGIVGLAVFYSLLGFFGHMPPKTANAQCSQATLKALQLDDMLAEAHAVMGGLRLSEFDWKGAEREFGRALELAPGSADVWTIYDFYYLVPMRRLDEAIAGTRRALELDPLSPFLQFRLGLWYYYTRQWDHTIEQCRNALELDPHYPYAHLVIGGSYIHTGKLDEAIQSTETHARLMGRSPGALGWLGHNYAVIGRTGEARRLLEELQEIAQKAYVQPFAFGLIYSGLGEIDRCFDWLEKAVDEREGWMLHIHADPAFDPLRSHPRYPALLRKMNLEP